MVSKTKQLQRIYIVILLCILFCSQVGYYVGGKVIQLVLKEQANERVLKNAPDSLLVAIPLAGNEKNIQWEQQDRELTYLGHMYDVVRIKKTKQGIVYLCTDDKLEDAIVNRLNDCTKSNHQPASKINGMPGVKLVYNQTPLYESCPFTCTAEAVHAFIDYQDMLQQPFSFIAVPPPRL